jgi:glutaredoxin
MRLHLAAWKNGLKSLYYLKGKSPLAKKNVVPALVVTKEGCPWCDRLKDELGRDGLEYREITKDEAVEKGYWNPEWTTVPQVWLYKKHIGGYNDYTNLKTPTETPTYEDCAACEG